MIRKFVETGLFETLVSQESDKELEKTIKDDILEDPTRGSVVAGTGGVRKFRVSDKGRNKGKRGGFRVIYFDLPKHETTYLLLLYNKDVKDDLTSDEKKALKKIVEGIKNEYEKKKKN